MYSFMSEGLEVDKCYATGAVLIVFVIVLNLLVFLVEQHFNRKAAGKKSLFTIIKEKLPLKRQKNETD